MRRGKSSLVHQVKVAVNAIDQIGIGKRELKKTGEQGIHSLKQKQNTMSAAKNFVMWTRAEFGVRNVYELKEEHYKAYLEHLESNGRSIGHRQNVETALRHLQKGMDKRSEMFNREKHTFIPDKRVTNSRNKKTPSNRSYSDEEYRKILAALPPNSQDAVKLCRGLGLRVKEAVRVEVQHFNLNDGYLKIDKGTGITKGGRHREIPIPTALVPELKRMIQGKDEHEHLIPLERDTVRRAVNKACYKAGITQVGRGVHGFRHAYSRARMRELFSRKNVLDQAPVMIERIMSNRDQGRQADYGIVSESDKKLFRVVKQAIDQVHGEIGHGKNRWDLAAVYMRD
ncbi:tyrosine-type recombinase/integrase [Bacillus testis]|uniref:tyrosine-type recombinase/integrase n=1 Tax=Bacillus testis TaxID=1622072 RepID=UPI0011CC7EFC|nr:tyrosine-type recombinase/integrase [Bacillus testis]